MRLAREAREYPRLQRLRRFAPLQASQQEIPDCFAVKRTDRRFNRFDRLCQRVLSLDMTACLKPVWNLRFVTNRQLLNKFSLFCKSNYATAVQSTALSSLSVQSANKADATRMLNVTWNNDTVSRYPFVYLRDNCQCTECFHESSLQRTFDTVGKLNMEIQPERVDVLQNGEQISVTWPDNHVSVFNSQWLHSRRLAEDKDLSKDRSSLGRKEGVSFWNAEQLQGNIPRHDFQGVIKDDLKLYEWMHSLHSKGIALVTNTPLETGGVNKLSARVGHAKTTHYGWVPYVFLWVCKRAISVYISQVKFEPESSLSQKSSSSQV